MSFFKNARETSLLQSTGSMPNMRETIMDWMQPMVFSIVIKKTVDFQVVETMDEINFMGVWQPLTARQLEIKPEGQRAWSWYWVHATPDLRLDVDDVVTYDSKQYRVMSKKDWQLDGYVDYELIEDFEQVGPQVIVPEDAP